MEPELPLHHHHHHRPKTPSCTRQTLLLLLLLPLYLPITFPSFTPSTNYLLSCGSSSPSTAPSSTDPRTFLPDDPTSHPSITLSFDGSLPISSLDRSLSLYSTARLFQRPSSYYFPITNLATHVLRLHFYPFPTKSFNLSTARFSVSASGLPLLPSFTPNSHNANNPLVVKEFFLNISITTLTISFSPLDGSFAYVSAIELFSAPLNLFPDSASRVPTAPQNYNGLTSQVLETLYRINIGGSKVSPINDLVWRIWEADGVFLLDKSLGAEIHISTTINYESSGTSTKEIAPDRVYQSARAMYTKNALNSSSVKSFNLTWALQVNSGGRYFVRMHFCDIVSDVMDQFVFNAYLNDEVAMKDIDLSTSISLVTPYYKDFVVDVGNSTLLQVGIGPHVRSDRSSVNAILNGLEVMGVSDGVLVLESPLKSKKSIGVIVGCVAAGCLVIVVAMIVVVVLKKKKKKLNPEPESQPESIPHGSAGWSPLLEFTSSSDARITESTGDSPAANLTFGLRIPFIDIQSGTNNFDSSLQIGSGGFGKVYKGLLRDGMRVAVKRATPGSRQGFPEFQTEISVLSKIRHRHLVSLIGYCDEQGEMILVYEFMEKGTLRDHLYSSENHPSLSWKQRLEICIGSAQGLQYLHTEYSQAIIHRDVKSANILLDENYLAKVADFGLSKLGPLVDQTHVSTGVKGSFGYLDPEYFKTQQLTEKSDVYSFGVVLLEVVCARPAIDPSLPYEQVNLADWGIKWQKRGMLEQIVDPQIRGNVNSNSLRKFGELVDKCLAPYGVDRPSMAYILWNLEYALQLQETTVSREPYEDSMSNQAEIPMVNIQRYPSTNTHGWTDPHAVPSVNAELGISQIFSQLITKEGR